jgi:hypothetical protein
MPSVGADAEAAGGIRIGTWTVPRGRAWVPEIIQLQGGSDISGTISMLHRRVEKNLFHYSFSAKPSQLSAET